MKKLCLMIVYSVLFSGTMIFLSMGCKKEKSGKVPVVTTVEINGITSKTAICVGDITSDGGLNLTSRGVCWATNEHPTIDDNMSSSGSATGSFLAIFKGLSGNTTYYACAFASNDIGTGYGEVKSFTTPPVVTDIDGNEYATVVIGTQTWMAENLKVKHYRNGDPINYIAEGETWGTTDTGEYCDYDLIGDIGDVYGNFYNWYAVADSRNISPEGWHVPTDEEWSTLIDFLGGGLIASPKMRESNLAYWHNESFEGCTLEGVTNSSGFSARAAGRQGDDHRGWDARFWTLTVSNINQDFAYYVGLDCGDLIYRSTEFKIEGFSLRCVKDQ